MIWQLGSVLGEPQIHSKARLLTNVTNLGRTRYALASGRGRTRLFASQVVFLRKLTQTAQSFPEHNIIFDVRVKMRHAGGRDAQEKA